MSPKEAWTSQFFFSWEAVKLEIAGNTRWRFSLNLVDCRYLWKKNGLEFQWTVYGDRISSEGSTRSGGNKTGMCTGTEFQARGRRGVEETKLAPFFSADLTPSMKVRLLKYPHIASNQKILCSCMDHYIDTKFEMNSAIRDCLLFIFLGVYFFLPPDHLLLDSAPNIGPLISRWELDKFKKCWNKSFRTSKIMTLLYQQFSNLFISQWDMSGPRLGALSNDRWSGSTVWCTKKL